MTIKLLLLKSGEDVIADVTEMASGKEKNSRIVGYFLNKPCIVKVQDPSGMPDDGAVSKSGFKVSLFPWMPLAQEETIPITVDWVITMVEPVVKLKQMYVEDIVNHGQSNQSNSTRASDSDK